MNIWVNGCFDILHTGHLDLLEYAKLYKTEGIDDNDAIKINKLIVGIDSDKRVKSLKGDNRPINNEIHRSRMLSSLKVVDEVIIFDSEDELKYYININKIDYMVIGDHYKNKRVVGEEYSKFGVIFYPTDERSSSNIIEKIKKLAN